MNVSGSVRKTSGFIANVCTNELSKKMAVVIALSKQEKDGVDVSKEGNRAYFCRFNRFCC